MLNFFAFFTTTSPRLAYAAKQFAQYSNCGFDSDKKLWFTGIHISNLYALIELYGVNEATSQQARKLLREKLEEKLSNRISAYRIHAKFTNASIENILEDILCH